MIDPKYDYYDFDADLAEGGIQKYSSEELAEWVAKAPRRVQDESKLSEGVSMLLAERRRLLEAPEEQGGEEI